MTQITPEEDAAAIRRYLESRVLEFAASGAPVSAIEIGYELGQVGWIYVHADRRKHHRRDGSWTSVLGWAPLLEMNHWVQANPSEVGEFILEIVQEARADGLFSPLTRLGPVQLDIEDFDGAWAWPAFEGLGTVNLA